MAIDKAVVIVPPHGLIADGQERVVVGVRRHGPERYTVSFKSFEHEGRLDVCRFESWIRRFLDTEPENGHMAIRSSLRRYIDDHPLEGLAVLWERLLVELLTVMEKHGEFKESTGL